MQTKDCTTCGAVGCDHKDVSKCGAGKYLWEPIPLHSDTEALIQRFAEAMRNKLAKAERKYGYSNLWANSDWMEECRAKLVEHLHKGDPLDVANYCAFLWHHGEHCKPYGKQMTEKTITTSQNAVIVKSAIDSGLALKTYGVVVLDETPTWEELYTFADTIRADEREQRAELEAEDARLREELATLSLYKNLAEQYGLSVFEAFAAAQKDAERYRWYVKLYSEKLGVPEEDVVAELDAAIDNAMKENKHEQV